MNIIEELKRIDTNDIRFNFDYLTSVDRIVELVPSLQSELDKTEQLSRRKGLTARRDLIARVHMSLFEYMNQHRQEASINTILYRFDISNMTREEAKFIYKEFGLPDEKEVRKIKLMRLFIKKLERLYSQQK